MTNVQFDHLITYTNASDIDDYLKEYEKQGFIPHEKTVRHEPGLRNGFISIGPEYLEFCWVENEELFATADAVEKLFRSIPHPFGLGIISDDVHDVHNDWTARGYTVPEIWSNSPRDITPDAPPMWSFQEIPNGLLTGIFSFVMTYHTRPKGAVKNIKIPPNTIYAISGVSFVTKEPESQATSWRDLLAPNEQINQTENAFHVQIGPHMVMWMTPEYYQLSYGSKWVPSSHSFGELAFIHLFASDLHFAKTMIKQSGRQTFLVKAREVEELLVAPDGQDGFTFIIQQQPVDTWLHERMKRTGEKLKLETEEWHS